MKNTEQILNRLIAEKDKKENLHLDIEDYSEIPQQKVIVRNHYGNNIWYYHTHSFYEINYVYKGSCINLVEEEPVLMNEGDLILMNPGTYHIPYCEPDGKLFNFIIDADWFLRHFQSIATDNAELEKFIKNTGSENFYRYVLSSVNNREIKSVVTKIIKINQMREKKKYLLLEAAMLEFLSLVMYDGGELQLSELKGKNSSTGRKLINYLSNNYSTATLESTAEYAGYSKTHICRIFKDNVGKSFGEVLTNIRIERAKFNLINTEKPVRDIAVETGYDSIEYFQRLFKRETGMTPGSYRKKYR